MRLNLYLSFTNTQKVKMDILDIVNLVIVKEQTNGLKITPNKLKTVGY